MNFWKKKLWPKFWSIFIFNQRNRIFFCFEKTWFKTKIFEDSICKKILKIHILFQNFEISSHSFFAFFPFRNSRFANVCATLRKSIFHHFHTFQKRRDCSRIGFCDDQSPIFQHMLLQKCERFLEENWKRRMFNNLIHSIICERALKIV